MHDIKFHHLKLTHLEIARHGGQILTRSLYSISIFLIGKQVNNDYINTTCVILYLYYSIFQLRNLQILNLSRNSLFYNIPDDMFTLVQSLRELDISMCVLSTLPKRYALCICSLI